MPVSRIPFFTFQYVTPTGSSVTVSFSVKSCGACGNIPCAAAEGTSLLIGGRPGGQIGSGKRGKVAFRSFFFDSRVQGAPGNEFFERHGSIGGRRRRLPILHIEKNCDRHNQQS